MNAPAITGSALERVEACAASGGVLPTHRLTTGEGTAGTKNHDREERALREGHEGSRPIEMIRTGAVWVEAEVAMALHPGDRTARLLGRGLGRDYGKLRDGEIPLTIDAVALHPDRLIVADWKSAGRVTPAARNLQVRAAMVGVRAMDAEPFGGSAISAAEVWIGYLDDGYVDSAPFDAFDAEDTWSRLAEIQRRARDASADDAHVGPWCKYCPSLAYCPATNALLRTAAGDLTKTADAVAFMSAEDVGKARTHLKVIQRLIDVAEQGIKDRANQEPIPLPNGKWLMQVESSRKGFDKDGAIERMRAAGVSLEGLETKTTFTTLRETTRKP